MPQAKAKRRVALLIDCDNQSHEHLDFIIEEAVKEGELLIRRAYGNWSSPQLAGWRKACEARGVRTVQTPTHVAGKNTSDIALVIEAMDIFHREEADAFCIVSSDSDFAQLAIRLREGGKPVTGIVASGSEDKPFASSCNRVLTMPAKAAAPAKPAVKSAEGQTTAAASPMPAAKKSAKSRSKSTPVPKKESTPAWVPRVVELIRTLSRDGDCPSLQKIGQHMSKSSPPITKTSKSTSLTKMLETQPKWFRLKRARNGKGVAGVCLTPAANKGG